MKSSAELLAPPMEPVPEVVPDTAALFEVASKQTAELDSSAENIVEAGARLLTAAAKSVRADVLDRGAYSVFNIAPMLGGVVLGGPALALSLMEGSMYGAGVSVAVVGAAVANKVWAEARTFYGPNSKKYREVQMPDGYALQCLRVANPSVAVPDGRVAVLVHPRAYKGQVEPAQLAKTRLADAFDVVAEAAEAGKVDIGSVIIPARAARAAGLPYDARQAFNKVVGEISAQTIWSPYNSTEQAVVVPARLARQLAELLRADHDPLLVRVFAELAERFPGKREALTLDNAAVVRTLTGLLNHTLGEEGGVRIKQKDMQNVTVRKQNDQGEQVSRTVTAWDGSWDTSSEDVMALVDTTKPFNPRITRRTARTLQGIDDTDLRSQTGGMETMLDIDGKLKAGSYSKLQLIRVALELLEDRQNSENPVEQDQTGQLPRGDAPEVVGLARKQANAGELRRRMMARVALTATMMFGIGAPAVSIAEHELKAVPLPAVTSPVGGDRDEGERIWRIDLHGLTEKSPYWAQNANYTYSYKRGGWRSGDGVLTQETLPTELANIKMPHLTVSTVMADNWSATALPIEDGTKLAAVRAYTVNRAPLKVDVETKSDGTVYVRAPDSKDTYYLLEYDLVASDVSSFHPTHPVLVARDETISDPTIYSGAAQTAEGVVSDIASTFIYDDGDGIKEHLSRSGKTPKDYVDILYGLHRCQCLECNTAAAMIASQLEPDRNMALMTGYLHQDDAKQNHGYLASPGHAWLDVDDGSGRGVIEDATAHRTDKDSHLPGSRPASELDALWTKVVKQTGLEAPPQRPQMPLGDILWPAFGLMGAGLAGNEMRRRTVRRAVSGYMRWDGWVTAAQHVDPRDGVRLLHWDTYGSATSPRPALDGGKSYRGERPDTIPEQDLRRVARRGLRDTTGLTRGQQRGVRRTAQAILRDRDYARRRGTRKK